MHYKLIFIFLALISFTSCANYMPKKEIANKDELAAQLEFPFDYTELSYPIEQVYTVTISSENLTNYNEQLNKTLENEFDGKNISYSSKDQKLKSEFKLKDSFKIVAKDLYCREYFQKVRYNDEEFAHNGVACRVAPKIWKNLTSKN